eukprot:2692069-Prymnesium_polylepis.2
MPSLRTIAHLSSHRVACAQARVLLQAEGHARCVLAPVGTQEREGRRRAHNRGAAQAGRAGG